VVVVTVVELLSVSTVESPETHTGPTREELALGPLVSSSNHRCALLFTRAERPEAVAASMLELSTLTVEPSCTRTPSVA
jgi:hypothetical protein